MLQFLLRPLVARQWEHLAPGRPGRWPAPPAGDGAGAVRAAMAGLLRELPGERALRLAVAVERCADLRALWFLRGALMQVLAAERGELGARRALADVDTLIRAGWPDAPVSHPAPLE